VLPILWRRSGNRPSGLGRRLCVTHTATDCQADGCGASGRVLWQTARAATLRADWGRGTGPRPRTGPSSMTTLRCSHWSARASPTASPSTATRSSSRWRYSESRVDWVEASEHQCRHARARPAVHQGLQAASNVQGALRPQVRHRLEADPDWFAKLQPRQHSPAEARFAVGFPSAGHDHHNRSLHG
jgi:hypothetical protein